MGRKYYFENLLRFFKFFNVGWFKRSYKAGKDSGYPSCCRVYFFVRIFFMDLYGTIFGNVDPFQGEVRSFSSKAALRAYQNSTEYKRKLKHVACPWHRLIYFLTKKEHLYTVCKECAWIQYEQHDCNNCAQHDFYNTKARRKRGI